MKIAILARVLNQKSGAKAPIKLAEYLANEGNEVDFYCFDENFDPAVKKSLEDKNIKVYVSHLSNIRVFGNLVAAVRLFFLLKGKKYDLLSAHIPAAFIIPAKLAGNFIVRTVYGTQLSQLTIARSAGLSVNPSITARFKAWLWDTVVKFDERTGFIFSDVDVAISKYLQSQTKALYGIDIPYIYLGAETDKFNSKSINSFKKSSNSTVSLLSVSRIVPYKGFDLIIKAFLKVLEKYPGSELNIIGSIADDTYLKYLNSLKNDKVKIINNPSDEQLLIYYQNCDIYVCGDLWAPWSLTPLEASFLAKPLLGLNRGAMSEIIINEKNGFLADNLGEFSAKMNLLVGDDKLREKLGEEAREIAISKFTWEKTAGQYLSLFKKSINNAKN